MRKNKQDFDFLDLLKDKGIISSSKSHSKEGSSLTLGGIFKEIVKELTTDPEVKNKPSRSNDYDSFDFEDYSDENNNAEILEPQRDVNVEEQRKRETAEAHRREQIIRREEELKREKKKKQQKAEFDKRQKELEEEKEKLKHALTRQKKVSGLLRNKQSLRDAFILSEILSKPVGLK